MRKRLSSSQSRLAAFYGCNETIFFFEISRDNVLHDFGRIEPILGRTISQPRLEFGSKVHFHTHKIR